MNLETQKYTKSLQKDLYIRVVMFLASKETQSKMYLYKTYTYEKHEKDSIIMWWKYLSSPCFLHSWSFSYLLAYF